MPICFAAHDVFGLMNFLLCSSVVVCQWVNGCVWVLFENGIRVFKSIRNWKRFWVLVYFYTSFEHEIVITWFLNSRNTFRSFVPTFTLKLPDEMVLAICYDNWSLFNSPGSFSTTMVRSWNFRTLNGRASWRSGVLFHFSFSNTSPFLVYSLCDCACSSFVCLCKCYHVKMSCVCLLAYES